MPSDTPTNGPTDAESRAWLRQIVIQKRRVEEETGVLRKLYQRAKNAGEDTEALRRSIAKKRRDSTEVVASMRAELRYDALQNIPTTAEALFDGLTVHITETMKAEDDIWSAQDKGYRAGFGGVPKGENPFPAGSEFFVAWDGEWIKGQGALARLMGENATRADASRGSRAQQTRMPGTESRQDSPRKAEARKKEAQKPPKQRSLARRPGRARRPTVDGQGHPLY